MIVYRVEASTGASWSTSWRATVEDVRRTARNLRDAGFEVHVDRLEVGTTREDIADALDNAGVSRVNWPGVPVE